MTPALKGASGNHYIWLVVVAAIVLVMLRHIAHVKRMAYLDGQIEARQKCIEIMVESNRQMKAIVGDATQKEPPSGSRP